MWRQNQINGLGSKKSEGGRVELHEALLPGRTNGGQLTGIILDAGDPSRVQVLSATLGGLPLSCLSLPRKLTDPALRTEGTYRRLNVVPPQSFMPDAVVMVTFEVTPGDAIHVSGSAILDEWRP